MRMYKDHLILLGSRIKEALVQFNELSPDAILFVVDAEDKLIGALTDGDVRRGLLKLFRITHDILPKEKIIWKKLLNTVKVISE